MFVSHAMRRHAETVKPDDTLEHVWGLMKEKDCETLPVLDKRRQLVGIVSITDVAEAAMDAEEDDFRQAITVSEVMEEEITTISEEEVLEEAAYIMEENNYTALPVVSSKETLVGIITRADVERILVRMMGFTQPGTRISLSVPDRVGKLADIAQIVKHCNMSIAGLATYTHEDASVGNVVLRLRTHQPKPVVEKLRNSGYRVLHVAQVWQ